MIQSTKPGAANLCGKSEMSDKLFECMPRPTGIVPSQSRPWGWGLGLRVDSKTFRIWVHMVGNGDTINTNEWSEDRRHTELEQ